MSAHFCPACGTALERSNAADEGMARLQCPACARIHYENPRVVVGYIGSDEGTGKACLRAVELADHETIQAAAIRAGAASGDESTLRLYATLSEVAAGRLHLVFCAAAVSTPGASRDSGWMGSLLARYQEDVMSGRIAVYEGRIDADVLRLERVQPNE